MNPTQNELFTWFLAGGAGLLAYLAKNAFEKLELSINLLTSDLRRLETKTATLEERVNRRRRNGS